MGNDEVKKKIIETLKNTVVNYDCGHEIKAGYFYMGKVFVKFADALIEAGIGDVSAMLEYLKATIRSAEEERRNLIEIQNIQLDELNSMRKEAEHRAEVAERALKLACKTIAPSYVDTAKLYFVIFIGQAEKELSEEQI